MTRKLALVTGASSGIGAAFARLLGARGYDLILTGRRKERLEEVAAGIRAAGSRDGPDSVPVSVETRIVELADPAALEDLAGEIAGRGVGLLVNNAGFTVPGEFADLAARDHLSMIATHVSAPVRLLHALLPGMLEAGGGAVINVSSLSAFLPRAGSVMYASTKDFLVTWSRALHAEYAARGLRVLALCPGFTRSDFHSRLGQDASERRDRGLVRWMESDQVAELGMRALERGRVVYLPGAGNRLLAGLSPLLRLLWSRPAPRRGTGSGGRV